jgi:EAL domain-containing protein (putative c-di-GMP-specific phosphodiesterase class I)
VAAIADLAHALDLEVEGVEDESVLGVLDEIGCEIAQGYHLCRPRPADEALAWIAASEQVPAV